MLPRWTATALTIAARSLRDFLPPGTSYHPRTGPFLLPRPSFHPHPLPRRRVAESPTPRTYRYRRVPGQPPLVLGRPVHVRSHVAGDIDADTKPRVEAAPPAVRKTIGLGVARVAAGRLAGANHGGHCRIVGVEVVNSLAIRNGCGAVARGRQGSVKVWVVQRARLQL